MTNQRMTLSLACVVVGLAACVCAAEQIDRIGSAGSDKRGSKLRVGTYDNRAIAVAYAHSKYNPIGRKQCSTGGLGV